MDFNSSRPFKVKKLQHVLTFKEANGLKSKATRARHSIICATIGKLHDLVPLVMNPMFKHNYLSSHANLTLTSFITLVHTSINNNF